MDAVITGTTSNTSKLSLSNPSSNLILFVFQLIVILIVICVSIFNLTFNTGDQNLWIALLSSNIGYLLPNPKLKLKQNE